MHNELAIPVVISYKSLFLVKVTTMSNTCQSVGRSTSIHHPSSCRERQVYKNLNYNVILFAGTMAPMARNTRRTLLEQRDQDRANHWIGIPETGLIVDFINEPTQSIVEAHTTPMVNPPAPTLNIPEPEPPQSSSSLDEQWASGNVTAVTTLPSKVTHLFLPALLTE